MTTIAYRAGRFGLANADVLIGQFATRLYCILVGENSSFLDEHPSDIAAFTTLDEIGARQNLGGISVSTDLTKNKVYIPSTLVTAQYGLVNGDGPVAGAIVYWAVGGGSGVDADNIPLWGFGLGVHHKVRAAETYDFPFPEDGLVEIPQFGQRTYLTGRKNLLEGRKQFTTGFRMVLVKEGSNWLSASNPAVIGDITEEFAGTGYTRKDITFTLTEDIARDRIVIDSPDVDFGSLDDDTEPIVGAVIFIPGSVNGVTDTLVYGLRLSQPINPGSTNFTWVFSADGVAYL